MKELINQYIEYLKHKADLKYYRCEHKWKLLSEYTISPSFNPNSAWKKRTYRCTKCCEHKILDDNNNN